MEYQEGHPCRSKDLTVLGTCFKIMDLQEHLVKVIHQASSTTHLKMGASKLLKWQVSNTSIVGEKYFRTPTNTATFVGWWW